MKTILIVDDEADIVWSLEKSLLRNPSEIRILSAHSGEKAVAILRHVPVDIVITDVGLPGMSGVDLLNEVRRHSPDACVIVMTALYSPELRTECIARGCRHFIEKPFAIDEMRSLVEEACNAPAQAPGLHPYRADR